MPSCDLPDTISSPANMAVEIQGGMTKTIPAVRKRSKRKMAAAALVSAAPVVEPLLADAGSTTEAGSPARDVDSKPADDLPALGISGPTSAVLRDERKQEAILNSLMPTNQAGRRMFEEQERASVGILPVERFRPQELEQPTLALRVQTRPLPTGAATSSWIRSNPAVVPPAGPFIVGPGSRLAWRRVP